MRVRNLGKTQIDMGQFGFGIYPLTDHNTYTQRPRPTQEEAIKTIQVAAEQGVKFFDTANAYCLDAREEGYGEVLLQKALSPFPKTTIATKGSSIRPQGRWEKDGRPASIRKALEASLKRLQTDCITLYQIHGVDPKVPLLDTFGEVLKLQKEGKIKHIGLSNVNKNHVKTVLAEGRIESVQNCLNAKMTQDISNGMIDLCQEQQLTYIAYSPFAGFRCELLGQDPLLCRYGDKYSCSPFDIAFAWINGLGDFVVPIPATTNFSRISDWYKAIQIVLTEEEMNTISGI